MQGSHVAPSCQVGTARQVHRLACTAAEWFRREGAPVQRSGAPMPTRKHIGIESPQEGFKFDSTWQHAVSTQGFMRSRSGNRRHRAGDAQGRGRASGAAG